MNANSGFRTKIRIVCDANYKWLKVSLRERFRYAFSSSRENVLDSNVTLMRFREPEKGYGVQKVHANSYM